MREITILLLAFAATSCGETGTEPRTETEIPSGTETTAPNDAERDEDPVPDEEPDEEPPASVFSDSPWLAVDGRSLVLDGEHFEIRGVCWSPVARGDSVPFGVDHRGYVELDAPLMAAAGINVVRTYGPVTDRAVLDEFWRNGIYVMSTVYGYGGDSLDAIDEAMIPVADHPAILMWVVGNEWNYNGLYFFDLGEPGGFERTRARVRAATERVKSLDDRPVVTIYGEIPATELIASLPRVDVWSLNVYRGASFFDLFDVWESRSDKPMFLGEYGADAYNALLPGPDPDSQAYATRVLTEELRDNHVSQGGVASGGTIFSWADEWWKDSSGSPWEQDAGGFAPGGGPYPDRTFNEEWWGIVDIDRNPRPAYDALQDLYTR
ncbi:MAG: glycoside hydrolase family 2 TIM barrel-domain containing protein [Myxococcota bacterium]